MIIDFFGILLHRLIVNKFLGVKAVDNLNTFVRKISGVDLKEKLASKLSHE